MNEHLEKCHRRNAEEFEDNAEEEFGDSRVIIGVQEDDSLLGQWWMKFLMNKQKHKFMLLKMQLK